MNPYPEEVLDSEEDDGTMPGNVETLSKSVVGRKIVNVLTAPYKTTLVLDNGRRVYLADTDDCCAYTELEAVTLNLANINHVITGVGTTDGYQTWHIFADAGDVAKLQVDWSAVNPFYYGYGFDITVEDVI